jgi:hypothetical protein
MEASENLFVTRAMKFNLGLFPPALCVLRMEPNAFIAASLPCGKYDTCDVNGEGELFVEQIFDKHVSLIRKNCK